MQPQDRFQENSNLLITDKKHDLQWLPKDSYGDLGKWINFQEAIAYNRTMNSVYAGGVSDWRLPTRDEAIGFYDEELEMEDWEGDVVHIHPVFAPKCANFMYTSEENEEGKVLRVNIRDGSSEWIDKIDKETNAARLVRDNK